MIPLQDIRYVRLGTANLEHAVEFAQKILGLQLGARERNRAYLRSDDREYTLCYVAGDPGLHATGFVLDSTEALDSAAAALEAAGHAVHWGTPDECEMLRVNRFVRFADPTGNIIELVWRPLDSGRRYFAARDAGITGFSHIGLRTTDPARDEAFWTQVCNARVSDWIGGTPLLRINPVHHTLALFPSAHAGIQHVNHQVASIDDVMRSYYFLREQGVRITFGPGRHPTSSAIFLYFQGPDGMTYEYSTGVKMITDEAGHRPRQFPFDKTGLCMWGSEPEIEEFRTQPKAVAGLNP